MTQNTDIKLFSRKALQLISQSIFFVYLCMYLLLVIIADYSKSTYHASDSLAISSGVIYYRFLIGRFGTGKYVNKFGPKNINYWIIIALITTILLHSWINHILNVRTSN